MKFLTRLETLLSCCGRALIGGKLLKRRLLFSALNAVKIWVSCGSIVLFIGFISHLNCFKNQMKVEIYILNFAVSF